MTIIRSVMFAEWPLGHKQAYTRASRKGELFEPSGHAAHWSPATHRGVSQRWGLWLDFLKRTDRYNEAALPAETVTFESLAAYIAELQLRVSTVTLLIYVRDLSEAVRVMDSNADLQLLRQAVSELEANSVPAIDKIADELGPSDLFDAAITRLNKYVGLAPQDWRAALAFGDGLLMAILAAKPIRASYGRSCRLPPMRFCLAN